MFQTNLVRFIEEAAPSSLLEELNVLLYTAPWKLSG